MDEEESDVGTFVTQNGVRMTYDQVREVMEGRPYDMDLAGKAAEQVIAAVNQRIDSRLEACYVPDRGDRYAQVPASIGSHRLKCVVSPESLPVLLRRLFEMVEGADDDGGDSPQTLAGDILTTLGFDEHGVFVGRAALGL